MQLSGVQTTQNSNEAVNSSKFERSPILTIPSNNTPFLANPKPILAAPLAIKSPPIIIKGVDNQYSANQNSLSVIDATALTTKPCKPSLSALSKVCPISMRGGLLTKGIHLPSKKLPETQLNDGSAASDHI